MNTSKEIVLRLLPYVISLAFVVVTVNAMPLNQARDLQDISSLAHVVEDTAAGLGFRARHPGSRSVGR